MVYSEDVRRQHSLLYFLKGEIVMSNVVIYMKYEVTREELNELHDILKGRTCYVDSDIVLTEDCEVYVYETACGTCKKVVNDFMEAR